MKIYNINLHRKSSHGLKISNKIYFKNNCKKKQKSTPNVGEITIIPFNEKFAFFTIQSIDNQIDNLYNLHK